jgi:hypothetical protein
MLWQHLGSILLDPIACWLIIHFSVDTLIWTIQKRNHTIFKEAHCSLIQESIVKEKSEGVFILVNNFIAECVVCSHHLLNLSIYCIKN